MRRKLLSVVAAAAITVGGGTLATASPAHAHGAEADTTDGWILKSHVHCG